VTRKALIVFYFQSTLQRSESDIKSVDDKNADGCVGNISELEVEGD
jgi:hypothetical protein